MKVYSETIHLFTRKCEKYLKEIITNETDILLKRSRFQINKYTYPLHIVAFVHQSKLGYFDPLTFQIGINQNLMFLAKESVIKDILRHEFAHYLNSILNPNATHHHGIEFKSICEKFNWSKSISKASMNITLANESIQGELHTEKLIRKVKALLKLAESDNPNEAQLATLKANQLLIKHNIKSLNSNIDDSKIYAKALISFKRKNAKLNCIYEILKHFLVKPVIVYGSGKVTLEVSGDKANIELAEYVADFMDKELDHLWKNNNQGLKGLKAKNSFIMGIAKGYDEKMHNLKKDFSKDEQKSLIVLNNNLDKKLNLIYQRLSHVGSNRSIDSNAYESGKKAGKNLTINSALKNKTKKLLLNWRS